MKKINYIQILKEAWKTTWKNRYLWWFGFFILLSGGNGFFSTRDSHEEKSYQQIADYISLHPQVVIFVGILIFLICLALLAVSIIGRGALIKSVQKNLEGKQSNFKAGFKDGKKYFWKLILIGLLTMIFAMAVMFIFIIPIVFLFTGKSFILGGVMTFLAIVVLIPALFLISFSQKFGSLYAVMADLSIWDSLEKGYYLVLKNVWASILMTLVLLLVSIIPCILFLTVLIFLAIPFLIIGGLLFLLFKTAGVIFTACLAGLVFLSVILLGGSILQVFLQTAWILFFKEIAKIEEKEEVAVEIEEKKIKTAEITSIPA